MAIENTEAGNKLTGFYRGTVKAHSDCGKCKIFWYGVTPIEFENTPDQLPDSEQAMPVFMAGSITENDVNGLYSYPSIGTTVWGFFENGDANHPVYFASTMIESDSNKDKFAPLKDKNMRGVLNISTQEGGNLTISINGDNESISIKNSIKNSDGLLSNSSMTMYKDGSISISSPNGTVSIDAASVNINASVEFNVNSNGNVALKGTATGLIGSASSYVGGKAVLISGSKERQLYT